MIKREDFTVIMDGMCEVFHVQPSQVLYEVYYKVFCDYTLEQIQGAVKEIIKTHKYAGLPRPAQFVEFIEGSRTSKAIEAWVQVLGSIRDHGYVASIEFKDPTISHCLREMGGWEWLCSQEKKDLPFIEKRFVTLYEVFLRRGVQTGEALIGFVERTNNVAGFRDKTPSHVRIGFDEDGRIAYKEAK